MARLVAAILAALVLHVLFMMLIVPERQLLPPEYTGAGQVTVSIARQSTAVKEEPPGELEKIEEVTQPVKEPEVPLEQVKETEVPPVPEKEPVETEKPVLQKIMPLQTKQPAATEPVREPFQQSEPETATEPEPAARKQQTAAVAPTRPGESETTGAAVAALRHPEPVATVNTPPGYPKLARKRGWQGSVILEVDVLKGGQVQNVTIHTGSGYRLLDEEAVKTVRGWQFSPGYRDGIAVPMKVQVPVHFILKDS